MSRAGYMCCKKRQSYKIKTLKKSFWVLFLHLIFSTLYTLSTHLAQDKELHRPLKVSIPINFTIPSLNDTLILWLELVLKTSPFVTNDPMSTTINPCPLKDPFDSKTSKQPISFSRSFMWSKHLCIFEIWKKKTC